jgi:zinc protease
MATTGERVEREVLENGLTIVAAEIPDTPVVAINLWVRAGYFDETDDQVGISHVVEHMFFKGTPTRPRPDQIAAEIKSLGGELNAGTYYESTNYYVVLPAANFEQGFAIQADALRNPLFDPEELGREKEAILQEARRKRDNPSAYATEMLYREAFDAHRIRRWRIGEDEGIRAVTREHLHEYYHGHYVPGRIVVAAAGGVAAATVFDAARRHLGDLPRAEGAPLCSPPEPPRREFRSRRIAGDIRRGRLLCGFRSAPILSDDEPALRILAHVLGGGRASRLYQAVKERDRLVDAIGAGVESFRDLGVFTIEAEGHPRQATAALLAIQAEVEGLRREPPTAAEIDRARTAIEHRYHDSRSEVLGRAAVLACYEALGGYELAEESVRRLSQVAAPEVRRVAEKWLDIEAATILEYVPDEAALEPEAPAETRLADLRRVAPAPALRDAGAAGTVRAGPPAAAPFHRLTALAPAGQVTRHRFEAGPTVVHEERRHLPLVTIAVGFRGGRSGEQRDNAGVTRLMQAVLVKGSRLRDARRVALEVDGLGTALERIVDEDWFGFSISLLSRHLDRGFDILADLVRRPAFALEEIEKERALLLAAQEAIRDQSLAHTFQLFRQAAFGSHPYALPAHGLQASVQSLRREDLLRWHRLVVRPAGMVVSIVGDTGQAEAIDHVGRFIAEWPQEGYGGSEPGELLGWGAAEVVETRRRTQTSQVIGFPSPGLRSPDRHILDVLQSLTSGLGGRFFEAIRGRRGLAYVVQTFNYQRQRGGAFVIHMATSPRDEAEARRVLFQEIARLRQDGPRLEEIERARRHIAGAHAVAMQTNAVRALRYLDAEVRDLGAGEVLDYPVRIAAVVHQDVADAAWRYLDPDRCAMGILRGESA